MPKYMNILAKADKPILEGALISEDKNQETIVIREDSEFREPSQTAKKENNNEAMDEEDAKSAPEI